MLFESKLIDQDKADRLFQEMRKRRILSTSAAALDAPIDEEEIREVMEHLPLGKSPGPDRIPNAVYRCLSNVFAPFLTEVIGECRRDGELPESFLKGDISMLSEAPL